MALLLHIDTATIYGAVALSKNEHILRILENNDQKEHASFLHPAISEILQQTETALHQIDAVAVTIGPGSYTGLRVGLAAAKGLCYALQKPLIAVNTLQAIALAAINQVPQQVASKSNVLYAPMIDARRMEVYTALYTKNNELYNVPQSLIINEMIFAAELKTQFIVFAGDGSKKLKGVLPEGDFFISETLHDISHVAAIALKHFHNNAFENIAYCEPLYLKPFFSPNFVKI